MGRNTPAADWPAATAADQKEFNPPDIRYFKEGWLQICDLLRGFVKTY